MKLKDYLEQNGIKPKWFAVQLGITTQRLYQIMRGGTPGKTLAILIEKQTRGEVKKEELLCVVDFSSCDTEKKCAKVC